MRSGFDKQLTALNREMISMGSLCENAIAMSAKALLDGDHALAHSVAELSTQIERQERDIESMCLKLLLQQQPVARDLRVISSASVLSGSTPQITMAAEGSAAMVASLAYTGEMCASLRCSSGA